MSSPRSWVGHFPAQAPWLSARVLSLSENAIDFTCLFKLLNVLEWKIIYRIRGYGSCDRAEQNYPTSATSPFGGLCKTTIAYRDKANGNLVPRPRDGLCRPQR